MPNTTPYQGRLWLGVTLVMATVLCFAISDVLTKYLTQRYPVTEIIAIRYIVSFFALFVVAFPNAGSGLWRTKNTKLLIIRGLLMCVGSFTISYALKLMPIGETIAIIYIMPFIVIAMSGPFLGEKVSPFGWAMTVLGFSGVLMVLNLSGDLNTLGVICALTNAVCIAIFQIMTRKLAHQDSAVTMLFYVNAGGLVVFCLAAIPSLGESRMPTLFDGSMMVLLGLIISSAHFMFARAYREAPASLLAPINYVHLVWAALLSWIIFDQLPNQWAIMGICLILGSGVAMSLHAHVNRKRQSQAASKQPIETA